MSHIICIFITIILLILIYYQINETFESTDGEQGDLGDQGIKGITGAKGAKGIKGDPGNNLELSTIGITFDTTKDQLNFPTNMCVGAGCIDSKDIANMKKYYSKCKFFLWDPPNTYRDYSSVYNDQPETKDGKWKRDTPTTNDRRIWSYGLLEARHTASHPAGADLDTYWHRINTEIKISQRVIGLKITSFRADSADYSANQYVRNLNIMFMPTSNYKNMLLSAAYLISLDTNQTGFNSIYNSKGVAPDKTKYSDKSILDAVTYLKSLDTTAYNMEAKRTYNALGETPVEPVSNDMGTSALKRGKIYVGIYGAFEIFFPRVVECEYIKFYVVKGTISGDPNTPLNQTGVYLCL